MKRTVFLMLVFLIGSSNAFSTERIGTEYMTVRAISESIKQWEDNLPGGHNQIESIHDVTDVKIEKRANLIKISVSYHKPSDTKSCILFKYLDFEGEERECDICDEFGCNCLKNVCFAGGIQVFEDFYD